MTVKKWVSRLKKLCKEAGTYQKWLDPVIEKAAVVLARHDSLLEEFEEGGCVYIEEHEAKNGATLKEPNQLIIRIEKCEDHISRFLGQLGLTVKDAKNSESTNDKTDDEFSQWVNRIGLNEKRSV